MLFQDLLSEIDLMVTRYLVSVQIQMPEEVQTLPETAISEIKTIHNDPNATDGAFEPPTVTDDEGNIIDFSHQTLKSMGIHISRNDPCPCGSGRRYKHCHGRLN